MQIEVTPLILTYNEKDNIGRTLAALSWVKQVVIVDSGSTNAEVRDQRTEISQRDQSRS